MIYYKTFKDLPTEHKRMYLLRQLKCAYCKTVVAEGLETCISINSCANYCNLIGASDKELNERYFNLLSQEKYTTIIDTMGDVHCQYCSYAFDIAPELIRDYKYCPNCGHEILAILGDDCNEIN